MEGGGGGRDECKAAPPAIPRCRSESSRSVLSGSEEETKRQRDKETEQEGALETRDNQENLNFTFKWREVRSHCCCGEEKRYHLQLLSHLMNF